MLALLDVILHPVRCKLIGEDHYSFSIVAIGSTGIGKTMCKINATVNNGLLMINTES
jgi:hypothetical protein